MQPQEMEKRIEELEKKIEEFTNSTTLSEDFLETLSNRGFLRIKTSLLTPFTTTDGYASKYYFLFADYEDKRLAISSINGQDFTIIGGINTTTNVFTAPTTGFLANDAFSFWTSGTPPSPLVNGGVYYVRDISGNTFKLSDTLGGAAVDITDMGSGAHYLQRINILY